MTAQSAAVEVHTLSHYDTKSGLLAVSDGGGKIWVRERGGEWQRGLKGGRGLIFFTDDDSGRWEPEFGSGGLENLHRFIDELPFDDHGRFSRKAQASLFAINLFNAFFSPWRRTRLISAFLGGQGAGKSTAQRLTGRLLVGPRFEASDVCADREDAFIAAITNKVVYAIAGC